METVTEKEPSLPAQRPLVEFDQMNFPEKTEKSDKERPETPSSDDSTSGVCSLASSEFDFLDENLDEKPVNDLRGEVKKEDKAKVLNCPVIIYQKRNILNLTNNIYPYGVYQTTSVPKMDMSNYWERRSIYHRLGSYGHFDEFDLQKCLFCDFNTTVPKRLW